MRKLLLVFLFATIFLACRKKDNSNITPSENVEISNDKKDRDTAATDSVDTDSSIEQAKGEFLKFELVDSVNQPNTFGTVRGEITDSTIVLNIDKNVDLTRLIASFKYRGSAVFVNAQKQQTGVTSNDFSKSLTYVVKGKNGASQSYTVLVNQVTEKQSDNSVQVEVGGNSYKEGNGSGKIADDGIVLWSSPSVYLMTYFRLQEKGDLEIWLNVNARGTASKLAVSLNNVTHQVNVEGSNEGQPVYAGSWDIKKEGYVAVKIKGVSKEGTYFPRVSDLIISGSATEGKNIMVSGTGHYYYGRRGPSVHLNYREPQGSIKWFYNEVTVKKGKDPEGSFFMAEGFSGGYFGMQVNSSTSRRFLFSLWSAYSTNDPNEIPSDYQVMVMKKGKNVVTGNFGNEGSGKNAKLFYNWKAGNTYGFLVHAEPNGSDGAIYTAYVYIPEKKKWLLMAQFNKPKTSTTSLKTLNSFSECFSPSQGDKERFANYSNQWVYVNGEGWKEILLAQFSGGSTGSRWDQSGGVEDGRFFLRAGGFFDDYIIKSQWFIRPERGTPPDINFNQLPKQ